MSNIGQATSRMISTNSRFVDTAVLVRNATGSYGDDGLYTPGSQSLTDVNINYQPASIDDRNNLPEGERLREAITVYIKSSDRDLLRPMRQGATDNTPGDIIRVNNLDYEVYTVESFANSQHIKAVCMRVEGQDD